MESDDTSACPREAWNVITRKPSFAVASKERSTPFNLPPAAVRMSKLCSAVFPLTSTSNTRSPACVATGSVKRVTIRYF